MNINRLNKTYSQREIYAVKIDEGHTYTPSEYNDAQWKTLAGTSEVTPIYKINVYNSVNQLIDTLTADNILSVDIDKTLTDITGLTSNYFGISFFKNPNYSVSDISYFIPLIGYEYSSIDNEGSLCIVDDLIILQRFYPKQTTAQYDNNTYTLECYDACNVFNYYTIGEYLKWSSLTAGSFRDILEDIISFMSSKGHSISSSYDTQSIPIIYNSATVKFSKKNLYVDENSKETLRFLLDNLFESLCVQGRIKARDSLSSNEGDKIYIYSWGGSGSILYNNNISKDDIISFDQIDAPYNFGCYRVEKLDIDTVTQYPETFTETATNKIYTIKNNIVLTNESDTVIGGTDGVAESVLQRINNVDFKIAKNIGKIVIDPQMIEDKAIYIQQEDDTYILIPLFGFSLSLASGLIAEWDNTSISREKSEDKTPTVANSYTTASVRVNKLEKSVTLSVEDTEDGTESKIEIDENGIRSIVGDMISEIQGRVTSLENGQSTLFTRTDFWNNKAEFGQKVVDIVASKLDDGTLSVKEVDAATNTFDRNGLHILQAESPTQTTIDSTGLYVTDMSGNEILSAGFDEDTNEAKVYTKNLTATWLKVGNFVLRDINDSNSSRVGFYYVGSTQ